MENRYTRNMNTFSLDENQQFKKFNICVVGCGGLGGYVLEMLGRLGIGSITGIDGDVFDETNLNRQILSTEEVLGREKAMVAEERMKAVNSEVHFNPIVAFMDEGNAEDILKGHHLVVDALDNIKTRKIVAAACEKLGIPLIHGAIAGWYGQVSANLPGDGTLSRIYPGDAEKGAETDLGNPSFTPALVASIQVSEAMKVLLGKGEILQNKLLVLDLLNHQYEVFDV